MCFTMSQSHIHMITPGCSADVPCAFYLFKQEAEFYVLTEDESPCIFGPIVKQRWSYACAKQLIERLVFGEWETYDLLIVPLVAPLNFFLTMHI